MNFVVVLMVLVYSKGFIEEGALGHLFIDGSLNFFFHLSLSLYSLSGVCVCVKQILLRSGLIYQSFSSG